MKASMKARNSSDPAKWKAIKNIELEPA